MRIIGIDPGVRHTGYNVLDGATSIAAGTIQPPGKGKMSVVAVLNYVLPRLHKIIEETRPHIAVVEEVTWYGRQRKITLPLSHIAGAILALCWTQGLPTYSLLPGMKKAKGVRFKKSWDEHQKDAAILAKVIADHQSTTLAATKKAATRSAILDARCLDAMFLTPNEV